MEVRQAREKLHMSNRPAKVHCDAVAMKEFVTYIRHRLYASTTKRDTFLQDYIVSIFPSWSES